MATPTNLTEGYLSRTSVLDSAEETHWDSKIRGLGVRVRNFGGKVSRTWIIKYRNAAGAQRKLTLGDWPGVTVKNARTLAKKAIGSIADKQDPARERATAREAGTVAGLLARFLKDHVKAKGRSENTAKEYSRLIEKVIKPGIGNAEVQAVERADVERWFSKHADTPRQANQALAVLSKAMNLAEGWRLRRANSNPCRGVERFPEVQRDRHPSADEYQSIGSALKSAESDKAISETAANVIRLLALTGLRLSEVCNLKWVNVNAKAGVITLDRVKSGKTESKTRVVGAATLAILASIERPKDEDGAYVFGDESPTEPVSKWIIEKAWQVIRKRTGIKDLRLHDLRHGVGTVAGAMGANAFLVRDKLGHATLAMTSRYVSKQTDPLKELSERIEGHVSAAMAGRSGRVERLSARRAKRT